MIPVTKRSKKQEIWEELQRSQAALAHSEQLALIFGERLRQLEGEIERLNEQTAFSVDRQRRLTAENEQLLLLLGLTQDLSAFDTDRILATAVQKIPYILQARSISLYLYDEERRTLVLKDNNHNRSIDPLIDLSTQTSSLMALAVRTRQTLIVSDVSRYQERERDIRLSFPNRDHYGTPSCLVTPLLYGDKVLGVINLADRFDGRPFDRADREAVTHVSNLMALALENAQKVEKLKHSVQLDPLTGLRNHRTFMELLEVEVKRASRYDRSLTLVVLDFESFGWINGNYGHPAGDAVLAQAARLINGNLREVDVVARIGGDEFALLFPEQNLNGALVAARRIRALLDDHRFRAGSHSVQVKATLGVAQLARDQDHAELMRAAEAALSEARRKGESIGVKT